MDKWSVQTTTLRAATLALKSQDRKWYFSIHYTPYVLCIAAIGISLLSWLLNSNRILLENQNGRSRYDPLAKEVELE